MGCITRRSPDFSAAREHGEQALLPHKIHFGEPKLHPELRKVIGELYASPQQRSPTAIHEGYPDYEVDVPRWEQVTKSAQEVDEHPAL
jgi:hypothetical protein